MGQLNTKEAQGAEAQSEESVYTDLFETTLAKVAITGLDLATIFNRIAIKMGQLKTLRPDDLSEIIGICAPTSQDEATYMLPKMTNRLTRHLSLKLGSSRLSKGLRYSSVESLSNPQQLRRSSESEKGEQQREMNIAFGSTLCTHLYVSLTELWATYCRNSAISTPEVPKPDDTSTTPNRGKEKSRKGGIFKIGTIGRKKTPQHPSSAAAMEASASKSTSNAKVEQNKVMQMLSSPDAGTSDEFAKTIFRGFIEGIGKNGCKYSSKEAIFWDQYFKSAMKTYNQDPITRAAPIAGHKKCPAALSKEEHHFHESILHTGKALTIFFFRSMNTIQKVFIEVGNSEPSDLHKQSYLTVYAMMNALVSPLLCCYTYRYKERAEALNRTETQNSKQINDIEGMEKLKLIVLHVLSETQQEEGEATKDQATLLKDVLEEYAAASAHSQQLEKEAASSTYANVVSKVKTTAEPLEHELRSKNRACQDLLLRTFIRIWAFIALDPYIDWELIKTQPVTEGLSAYLIDTHVVEKTSRKDPPTEAPSNSQALRRRDSTRSMVGRALPPVPHDEWDRRASSPASIPYEPEDENYTPRQFAPAVPPGMIPNTQNLTISQPDDDTYESFADTRGLYEEPMNCRPGNQPQTPKVSSDPEVYTDYEDSPEELEDIERTMKRGTVSANSPPLPITSPALPNTLDPHGQQAPSGSQPTMGEQQMAGNTVEYSQVKKKRALNRSKSLSSGDLDSNDNQLNHNTRKSISVQALYNSSAATGMQNKRFSHGAALTPILEDQVPHDNPESEDSTYGDSTASHNTIAQANAMAIIQSVKSILPAAPSLLLSSLNPDRGATIRLKRAINLANVVLDLNAMLSFILSSINHELQETILKKIIACSYNTDEAIQALVYGIQKIQKGAKKDTTPPTSSNEEIFATCTTIAAQAFRDTSIKLERQIPTWLLSDDKSALTLKAPALMEGKRSEKKTVYGEDAIALISNSQRKGAAVPNPSSAPKQRSLKSDPSAVRDIYVSINKQKALPFFSKATVIIAIFLSVIIPPLIIVFAIVFLYKKAKATGKHSQEASKAIIELLHFESKDDINMLNEITLYLEQLTQVPRAKGMDSPQAILTALPQHMKSANKQANILLCASLGYIYKAHNLLHRSGLWRDSSDSSSSLPLTAPTDSEIQQTLNLGTELRGRKRFFPNIQFGTKQNPDTEDITSGFNIVPLRDFAPSLTFAAPELICGALAINCATPPQQPLAWLGQH